MKRKNAFKRPSKKKIRKLLAEDMKTDEFWERGKNKTDLIGKAKGPIKFVGGGSCSGK